MDLDDVNHVTNEKEFPNKCPFCGRELAIGGKWFTYPGWCGDCQCYPYPLKGVKNETS